MAKLVELLREYNQARELNSPPLKTIVFVRDEFQAVDVANHLISNNFRVVKIKRFFNFNLKIIL